MMVENLMLKTPRGKISDDLPLFGPEGLGLDSIDALELVVSLEKHFGVVVPNSEVAKSALANVNTIADYVLHHQSPLRRDDATANARSPLETSKDRPSTRRTSQNRPVARRR